VRNSVKQGVFARAGRRARVRDPKHGLAVGHSLLVIFYHMLKSEVEYQDLGVEYFDRLDPERLRRSLVKRLERLGYQVTLTTQEEAA
jgi:transposase